MSAQMAALLNLDRLGALFKAGQTALGHHWELQDGEGTGVGRTKLTYEGAGKTVGRLMRVTGLSQSGTIHAVVLGSEGDELFRLRSAPGKQARVDLTDAAGAPMGGARRRDLSLELLASGSDAVVGTIARESKEDLAFPILSADGERVGVLAKRKVQMSAPSITEMVLLPELSSNSIAFQATMHFGFAGGREYHLLVEQRPAAEPLRTLVALAPVIAAYAY